MANNTSGRKSSNNTRKSANSSTKKRTTSTKKNTYSNRRMSDEDLLIINYAVIIGAICLCVMLFLCNFGLVGDFGEIVSRVMFGLFGKMAYLFPVFLTVLAFLWISKQADTRITSKIIAVAVLFIIIGMLLELGSGLTAQGKEYDLKEMFLIGYDTRKGGGIFGGSLGFFLNRYLDKLATIIICVCMIFICLFFIFGKGLLDMFVDGGSRIRETTREVNEYRKEQLNRKILENEQTGNGRAKARGGPEEKLRKRQEKEEQRRLEEQKRINEENDSILRMDKKVSGVSSNTSLKDSETPAKRDDIHEITFKEKPEIKKEVVTAKDNSPYDSRIKIHTATYDDDNIEENVQNKTELEEIKPKREEIREVKVNSQTEEKKPSNVQHADGVTSNDTTSKIQNTNKKYKFPPLSLLSKNERAGKGDSANSLQETARKLEDALDSFGVSARVTDVSQGPSVTRYELEPAVGVKVSRITSLSDDLKLHLAAKDIRIEAPIPGKSAVGIEVPNSESSAVMLRELLEDNEFKNFNGNIAFAVGKDIAGKVIVTDISKMPHMLIAGSTGSGKSVCINTIIMSIIYKHDPKDVQLIMVDPKFVELNVYNGIPHLMIPVVTDPKKAAGALNWAVAEMTDRYRKFAELNVRDLKGYNKKVEDIPEGESEHKHLPQIVIIVDELADLMMVAAKEVEEAICRLAQLARACGIHLLLATQRPSVDVITGLIKANMPSRVAFAVTSGTDSRTILDMNGAEKLLGKGDMLFYPQGYTKPARIQGAFVSDKERDDVVEFVKNQRLHNEFSEEASQSVDKITSSGGTASSSGASSGGSENDDLFVQAGFFIIEAEKASIGNLQRKFKIGFNRAARIMDQLCEAGVVGEEQGTKPREILMGREQFEQYIEDYV